MNFVFSLLIAIIIAINPLTAFSQQPADSASQLQDSWIVVIQGDEKTRTLRIYGVREAGDVIVLDAVYGYTDGNQTPVKAEVVRSAGQLKLNVTTQPGSKIITTQNGDGAFVGTFTPPNGQPKSIVIQKFATSNLAALRTSLEPKVIPPGSDVPAACAVFTGGWTGNWGFGKRELWVTEIDPKCLVKYSDGNAPKSAEIKNGALSFPCGTTGGTCAYTNHGDELWGRYNGPDGSNNAVYKKIVK